MIRRIDRLLLVFLVGVAAMIQVVSDDEHDSGPCEEREDEDGDEHDHIPEVGTAGCRGSPRRRQRCTSVLAGQQAHRLIRI